MLRLRFFFWGGGRRGGAKSYRMLLRLQLREECPGTLYVTSIGAMVLDPGSVVTAPEQATSLEQLLHGMRSKHVERQ